MEEQALNERLDFDLKIRLAGAICSSACIIARAAFFMGSPINPLIMLIPYIIAVITGFVKVMFFVAESEELMDSYESIIGKFRKKHAAAYMLADLVGGTDICISVMMIFLKW